MREKMRGSRIPDLCDQKFVLSYCAMCKYGG